MGMPSVSSKDDRMKIVAVSLVPMAFLLFGTATCYGEEQRSNSGLWSLPGSARPGEPTDPNAIRDILQRYLDAPDSPYDQRLNPVLRQGDRILPYVLEVATSETGENWRVYSRLGRLLSLLSNGAQRKAAPELLRMLTDENASLDRVDGVLIMIGGLGEPGLVLEPQLIALRWARPALRRGINIALIRIRATQTRNIHAERLAREPSESLLDAVANQGAQARDAGPEVVKLLSHPNWDMRLAAARTLGRIGYTEAIPVLIDFLDEPTDVRINREAAESLGRLGALAAVGNLKETAASHWHWAVRNKAKNALEHIATGRPYGRGAPGINRIFGDVYWRIEWPRAKTPDFLQEPPESKLYKETSPKKVRELSYRDEITSFRAADEEEQRAAKGENASIVINEKNRVRFRKPVDRVPDVALRVENGWLVGSDRGEWGGELMFVADDGQRTYVRQGNVYDLFKLGDRYIALTGYAHFTSRGQVYTVESTEDGRWVCELWRILPGAPELCGKLPSGEIFISTGGGGDVILSQDGTFRMAP